MWTLAALLFGLGAGLILGQRWEETRQRHIRRLRKGL